MGPELCLSITFGGGQNVILIFEALMGPELCFSITFGGGFKFYYLIFSLIVVFLLTRSASLS